MSQRIHLSIITAMLIAGSTALALAQSGGSTGSAGGTSGSSTGTPSAVDTTGMGGSRPGCGPSTGNPSAATAGSPPDATTGMRTPRIINDPTVGTSQTAETGLKPNTMIPKDPKTGRVGDC